MLHTDNKQYHIAASRGQIGKYCILPGDPGRCEKIAAYLENPYHLCSNREYNIWNGTLCGELVSVCSTGIGGPSAAIAMEELYNCGAQYFIRVGTCGGISLDVRAGDIIVATGSVRQDGTSREYAPIEFPAVASPEVLIPLLRAAKEIGSCHAGVVQSKDSFYGEHSPARMPTASDLLAKWEAWKRLNVLVSEMESATLFTVAAALGVKAGAVFLCVWNQERYEQGLDSDADEVHDTDRAIKAAINAIKYIIEEK